jgi:hypothetical protein
MPAVAPRTRRLHSCRKRREADRQQISIVALFDARLRLIRWKSAPRCPRRISPHPSTRLGPRLLRRKYPVPVLRAGTGLSQQDPIPRQGAPQRGPKSRADVLPRGTARGKDYAWPMRHSVGRKVALKWNICLKRCNLHIGLKVICPGSLVAIFDALATHSKGGRGCGP